jgi:hypothetical protein
MNRLNVLFILVVPPSVMYHRRSVSVRERGGAGRGKGRLAMSGMPWPGWEGRTNTVFDTLPSQGSRLFATDQPVHPYCGPVGTTEFMGEDGHGTFSGMDNDILDLSHLNGPPEPGHHAAVCATRAILTP